MDSSSDSGVSEDSGRDLMARFRKIVSYKIRTSRQEAETHRLAWKMFKFEGLVEISPPVNSADPTTEPVINPVPDPVLNCVLHSDKATLPVRASAGARGYDLSAASDICIPPWCLRLVALDCAVGTPLGFLGLVLPRSGLALRCSVESVPGVIDSDFRGTICALLCNCGSECFAVHVGDRVAQLVIMPCLSRPFHSVTALSHRSRSEQGFRSTRLREVNDCIERSSFFQTQGISRGAESVQPQGTSALATF